MGEDEDGETIFQIQNFMSFRPDSYKSFYGAFFKHQLEMLDHFGFMEFLNLTHYAAHDSV